MSGAVMVLLLSFALSSCLVPQSVDPDTTRLPTVPVIDLTQLPSHMLIPMIPLYKQSQADVDQGCVCHLQLVIPVVKEDDPTVDVEARWFLDYDLGNPASHANVSRQDFQGSFTNPAVTRGPVTFDLDADSRGLAPGPHVVEVMIAETAAFAADTEQPPFRALKINPPFDATTFKIVVDVKNSASATTPCDRNTPIRIPPLQRVCTQ
ncbi:MAG TPA: hypothetical protein VFE76_15315 [Myxococcales bacterium]|nr:hypothetical protein [Myxococcales bacterium]